MSAWTHPDRANVESVVSLVTRSGIHDRFYCEHCKAEMESVQIGDIWNHTIDEIREYHNRFEAFDLYVNEIGMEANDFLLRDEEPTDTYCYFYLCKTCGWWVIQKSLLSSAIDHQIWQIYLASAGVLKNLDTSNIQTPMEVVRSYLAAKYQCRFSLHPRLFEETVASVFHDLGYHVKLTAYSEDGGIDVFLYNSNNQLIGVQVKRYKNKIGVEQIRSFLGALTLNKCVRGIFVTTSDYEKGAHKAAEVSKNEFVPIELINSELFLDLLKVAQLKQSYQWKDYQSEIISSSNLSFLCALHLNPL